MPACLSRRGLFFGLLPASVLSAQSAPAFGGTLTAALRSDVKTFLPLAAIDDPTRSVLSLCHIGLIRTNGITQQVEGMLAESWKLHDGGRRISVRLRPSLRFSDGAPLTADDVVFTLRAHLDPRSASPQRDLLILGGKPVEVRKTGPLEVDFLLAQPSALAERLLDEMAILPRHRLEPRLTAGTLATAWSIDTAPHDMAASGPFRIAAYRPAQSITLERNPHFWKAGPANRRLPYLDRISFVFTAGEDAQMARLIAGECDVVPNLGAANTALLEKYAERRELVLYDLGPGLDAVSLIFNLDPNRTRQNPVLLDRNFRAALSASLDRASIARLVYRGRAAALGTHVSPGRRDWVNTRLAVRPPNPRQSLQSLQSAGFRFDASGQLFPPGAAAAPVRLTLLANSSNPAYTQTATILASDLQQARIPVTVVTLEFRSFVDRLITRRDFDMAVVPLRSGHTDPMADMNILLSSGPMHLWNPAQAKPATPWEAEIDRLMQEQATATGQPRRKRAYDRVQEILAEQCPLVPLVSPHMLVAARRGIGNFRPSILPNAALWNAEELYWKAPDQRR